LKKYDPLFASLTLVFFGSALRVRKQAVERRPVQQFAIHDDRTDTLRVADVVEGISVEQDKVGDFAGFY
jgi:hypothetical protein